MNKPRDLGQIITFYSYKGGTGRTMALANVARELEKLIPSGQRVLIIDWDLEAPGLHHYFREYFDLPDSTNKGREEAIREHIGLVDLMGDISTTIRNGYSKPLTGAETSQLVTKIELNKYVIPTTLKYLHLLKAGRQDKSYAATVNSFNWDELFQKAPYLMQSFAYRLAKEYEYVLIDSRTGITDISGICTSIMPEKLAVIFTPNQQCLEGFDKLIPHIVGYRQQSSDVRPLVIFPVASRIDLSEPDLYKRWRMGRGRSNSRGGYESFFELLFKNIYDLEDCDLHSYFNEITLQHVAQYSYGEQLAVIAEDAPSRLSLGRSYNQLTKALIDSDSPWEWNLVKQKDSLQQSKAAKAKSQPKTPIVFVSSTAEDLKFHREQVRDAVLALGLQPRMQEYFPASGEHPPYQKCMELVDGAGLVVAIIAHRYGWIPPDQPENDDKSITWLECLHAAKVGEEIFAFVVDEAHDWPMELKEEYAINEAIQNGNATLDLLNDVQNRVNQLKAFKAWVNAKGVRASFTTPESLRSKVSEALHYWIKRRRGSVESETISGDSGKYLAQLREITAYVDIRGLQVGSGKPHRFPIDQLYIPLTTPRAPSDGVISSHHADRKGGSDGRDLKREHVALQEALSERLLVIIGDPGSGKTTFLKQMAFSLLQSWSGEDPVAAKRNLGLDETLFPLMASVAELADFIVTRDGNKYSPQSANWLAAYLEKAGGGAHFGLSEDWFLDRLSKGQCLIMLDGLDAVSDRVERKSMSALIARLAAAFEHCRFVVTTRPAAYVGEVILPGFSEARIADLSDEAIEEFLRHWCDAIHFDAPSQAQAHRQELLDSLRGQVEIRRLARNPVMLTALAVIHWNEKRIPEQRAELYEAIITWLARARERRQGRLAAERCVEVLQQLALAMQCDPNGRQIQVERRVAAEWIADELAVGSGADENEDTRRKLGRAETFLAEEELDSGIVVKRGNHIRFWHLTFQEYLAARAIAGRGEEELKKILWQAPSPVYVPEWREAILLLFGILHQQGRSKVDGMIREFMDDLGDSPTLADSARCVGLLGAVLRDLSPFAYHPGDARYRKALDAVMAIFETESSASIPFEDRLAAAHALGQAGDPRLSEDDPALWVEIPEGERLLGAQSKNSKNPGYDEDADEDEAPVNKVFLDAFRIGRYPVTVAAYQRFVEHGGYEKPDYWKEGGFSQFQEPEDWENQLLYPNRPVVGVSWFEAQAFCAWAGGRLPSEAEWEKAARGIDCRKYPWGNDDADQSRLNCDGNVGYPTPVGLYPRGASREGLQDMAGNVWEWCQDRFDESYYKIRPDANPPGPDKGQYRVLRGGSWVDGTGVARCAYRGRGFPDGRSSGVGFRMVL